MKLEERERTLRRNLFRNFATSSQARTSVVGSGFSVTRATAINARNTIAFSDQRTASLNRVNSSKKTNPLRNRCETCFEG